MGDGDQAVTDAGSVDPWKWFDAHRSALVCVFDLPIIPNLEVALRLAAERARRAARLADRPRARRRARHRLPPYLRRLLRPEIVTEASYAELFGRGCPLWRAAEFLRRLWRKIHPRIEQGIQRFVNRPSRRWRGRHPRAAFARA